MRKAIVTIAIGDHHLREFQTYSLPTFHAYAKRHGFDVIVLTEPFAPLDPSGQKTIHWHKLLVGQVPQIKDYDRVVWIDTDIMINAVHAPDITEGVPENKIGVVEFVDGAEMETATERLNTLFNIVMREHYDRTYDFVKPVFNIPDHYARAGLNPPENRFCNTGVFVFSPKYHNEFLAATFLKYDSNFDDFENTPFSYEIFANDLGHGIDRRFNTLWSDELAMKYPFLARREIVGSALAKDAARDTDGLTDYERWYTWCVNVSFHGVYCLHFSGGRDNVLTKVPMRFVKAEAPDIYAGVFPEDAEQIAAAPESSFGTPFSTKES